jgi:hypothetical protein
MLLDCAVFVDCDPAVAAAFAVWSFYLARIAKFRFGTDQRDMFANSRFVAVLARRFASSQSAQSAQSAQHSAHAEAFG